MCQYIVDVYIFLTMLLCTCMMCEHICLSVCVCMNYCIYLHSCACFYVVFEYLCAHVCDMCVYMQRLYYVEMYLLHSRSLDLPRPLLLFI